MSNGPRRTSNFLPGGLAAMAAQRASGRFADPRQTINMPMDFSRPVVLGADILGGKSSNYATAMPTAAETARQSALARQRRQSDIMKAFGLGAPSNLPQADVAAPTSAGIADTVASYLPETGTPEMAGLGAAGRTMMQLGGWQDKPYTLGQILGAGAEKGLEAMKARQDAMTAAAEKKAAAEQKAKEFALEERYKKAQIAQMEKDTRKPFEFKQQTVRDPKTGKIGKADVAYVVPGSPEAVALEADDAGRVVRWGTFVPDKGEKVGIEPIEGIFLEDGELSSKRVYRRTTETGKQVTVVEDKDAEGGFRAIKPNEEFISEANLPGERDKLSDVRKVQKDLSEQSSGIRAMQQLYEGLDKVEGGFEGLATALSAKAKTLVGKDLTPKERARQLAIGLQQGILGKIRVDVVGPGVMTEQDAQRLIARLGGDLNNITTDPKTVKAAIGLMLRDKMADFNDVLPDYNRQRSLSRSASTFKKFSKLEIPEFYDPFTELAGTPTTNAATVNELIDRYHTGQYQQ